MKNCKMYASAFAAALFMVAGCSDDIENVGIIPDNPDQDGYYMTVNIATGAGAVTKAGENGDGSLEETANTNEAKVHDVNIFLIEGALDASDPLKNFNQTDGTVKIAGHGFKSFSSAENPQGGIEPNHDKATVKLSFKEPLPDQTSAKTYAVYTVVNAGNLSNANIKTLANLRDYVYSAGVWTGNAMATADKFVMSTHMMKGQVDGKSEVSISTANMDPANPAQATVYVERLAARIDLKISDALKTTGYTSSSSAGVATNKGTFKLTNYTVVNKWKGESYMFKQVSPTVKNWTDAMPAAGTQYAADDPHKYLGDEIWGQTVVGADGSGKYNYVIDPKSRDKNATTAEGYKKWTASYDNHFVPENQTILNNVTGWTSVTNPDISTSAFTPISYTKENVVSQQYQRNGFSTGLIFETTFTPNNQFTVSKYNETTGVVSDKETLTTGADFYVADHAITGGTVKKVVYADVKSIAALAFDGIDSTSMTAEVYKAFMGGTTATFPQGTTLETVKGLIAQMKESNGVEQAFKTYLTSKVNAATTVDNAGLNYGSFIANNAHSVLATQTVDATFIGKLFENYQVSCYAGGKSYHKYWIRHENNKDANVMGVMEFGIVRNNVYQLNVTGVRDFGDPLPYTPGKDDPNNPSESDEVYILVNLYVKDWVVRTNPDIIL